MKRLGKILGLAALITVFVMPLNTSRPAFSEDFTCPDIVVQALTATDTVCDGTGRNQACYGHVQLKAEPQAGVERFTFDQEGDVANVFDMQSLRLTGMDTGLGVWGVALMNLQASLPDAAPKQNITVLLFGEVEIDNAVESTTLLDLTVEAADAINVRITPSTQANFIATADPGAILTATGRMADNNWLRVRLDDGRTGWVYASLVSTEGDIETLAVVEPASVYYSPMQAFYFQSGVNDAACPEAPNSGLLIQTPEGVGTVTFLINEVDIQLGSTVFFEAESGGEMTVSVVEGHARVTSGGVSYVATAGTEIGIPMGEGMVPSGVPSFPRPYSMETVSALPVGYLPRVVEIAPPLTAEEMEEYLESPESGVETGAGESGVTPALGGGWETAPGLEGAVPPGQGGEIPPGQIGKEEKEEKPPKP